MILARSGGDLPTEACVEALENQPEASNYSHGSVK